MANTLTGLLPDIYAALDVVSRELTGFIPAVSRDSGIERAAVGQDVIVPVTDAAQAADTVPDANAPNTGDANVDSVTAKITKSRHVAVKWNGEETKGLQNAGTFGSIQSQRFYQAFRTLVNEIEADCALETRLNASRAYGTAGSTPFATANDMTDFSGVLGLLEENGAPTNDLQLVLGHSAIGNLRGKQSGLFKVSDAGREDMLRNGMTDRVMNMALRHSNAVRQVTKGSGAGFLVNGAVAAGVKTIAVDTGTGLINSGDVVTFAGDSNKYVAGGLNGSNLVLNKAGLLVPAIDNTAITVGGNFTGNVAFARSAIALATRAPAMPEGGDSATDVTIVTDPVTGLSFEIAAYRQFRQVVYHVAIAWGVKAVKQEHIALLLG